MDPDVSSPSRLVRLLKERHKGFQTYMQRLIAKYNQPFEDDPLVQMATLTYETPQGLRVWGGKLIKERNKGQTQDPSVKMITRLNRQALEDSESFQLWTDILEAESSSAGTRSDQEEQLSYASMVREASSDNGQNHLSGPGSPLKNDLRRKYLAKMHILLRDEEYFKNAEKRDGKDALMPWVPSSPVTPEPGCQDSISTESFSSPKESTSADTTIIPRNGSFSLLETSSNSLSSQSPEADDICNVTVSDMYEGMIHSMSRLLSLQPSCIISTKTYINQNWNLRRRLSRKSGVHLNRTYCYGSKPSRRSSKPGKEATILRNCTNLPHIVPLKTDLNLERGALKGSKLQVHKCSPAWKALHGTPQKCLDLNTPSCLEPEKGAKAFPLLISPGKIVPRPRMLPGEIEMKFDKLAQECSLSSGKQLCQTGPTESWAVDVYRGGSRSPGSPQGIKTHRLSSLFNREKAKRSSEAFEDLSKISVKASRCLPRRHPALLASEDSTSQNPGLSLQGPDSGPIRKTASPRTAVSAPWRGSWPSGEERYEEIKKEFDKLYQKYCLMSPQRVKVTSYVRVSPKKAGAAVPCQTADLRKLNPDSGFRCSPKLSTSDRNRSLQGSVPTEAHISVRTARTSERDSPVPAKRCKLSYSPSGAADQTMPWA
ncbi:Holliday junction recognition protein [Chionomys nivalis]|uniref:Holliday junction recognition protein n=1 Tax=Chionomys nivalis TaxID=269649 RepID=UPI002595D3CC|nr:Holliday junction recognition protein [Chionomys nivalis]